MWPRGCLSGCGRWWREEAERLQLPVLSPNPSHSQEFWAEHSRKKPQSKLGKRRKQDAKGKQPREREQTIRDLWAVPGMHTGKPYTQCPCFTNSFSHLPPHWIPTKTAEGEDC